MESEDTDTEALKLSDS